MNRLRLLVWLVSLVALVAPPGMTLHAMAPTAEAMADCAEHAPPPCPDDGTAKHAASTCCPLMAGAVALLPPVLAAGTAPSFHARPAAPVPGLAGVIVTKDPPPPRV